MLPWFPSAQEDHPNRGNEHQDADDLEGQIVVVEKQSTDVPHIVGCRSCQRRKSPSRRLKVPNDNADLNQQDHGHANAARGGEPVDPASFFGADVEKHDDEKKEHHHGACIDQNLNDADKKRVEGHEQR